jgi:hypothetical protein
MLRPFLVASIVASALLAGSVADLTACGDKFLRAGRSARQRNYAAAYPASILIFKSTYSTPAGLADWQKMLKRAGHDSLVVADGADLAKALAGERYDVVIADYGDVQVVGRVLSQAGTTPGVLPVLRKSSKAVKADARRQFTFLIEAGEMTDVEALKEIDRLMQLRVKRVATATAD